MYIIIIVTSFKNAFRSSSLPSSLVAAYKAIWGSRSHDTSHGPDFQHLQHSLQGQVIGCSGTDLYPTVISAKSGFKTKSVAQHQHEWFSKGAYKAEDS
jgi:hypothetical protein